MSLLRRRWVPILVTLLLVLFAAFGDGLTPYGYAQSDLLNRNLKPWLLGGTLDHPLGTDRLGRDVLARLVLAVRISLGIAALGTLLAAAVGTLLGLMAAALRGLVDETIMMLVDIQATLPFIVVALAVLAFLGNNITIFVVLMGLYGWETYARLARGAALAARGELYAKAAVALGIGPSQLYRRHILPNIAGVLIVQLTLNFPHTILLETGLSFLGLGIQPPLTSLGQMLGEGRDFLVTAWWVAVIPGSVLFVTTLAVSRLGDGLRDWLDPKQRAPA